MNRAYWFGALAALLAASGVSHGAEKVHVATPSRVIFAIPFWVAEHKGYFKDENIEATLEVVGSGKEITARLKSGASQFSIVGPDASIIDAMKDGPQRVVAGIVRKPPLFLVARPGIKTFADLKGANIGALSLTEGSSKLLVKMARAEGLTREDLKITAVGGAPARHTLLKDGKIDAGMQPMPLNYEAEALGFNNLGWAGKYEPDWQFTTVNTDGEWARRNPKVVAGFVRALLRGHLRQSRRRRQDRRAGAQDARAAGGARDLRGSATRHSGSAAQLVRARSLENVREHAGRRHDAGGPQVRCQEGR
jgi:ABC-type nitrate/sulfonate/bicarbonate transport system substrate-binding protein